MIYKITIVFFSYIRTTESCSPEAFQMGCALTYSFQHKLSISDNVTEFTVITSGHYWFLLQLKYWCNYFFFWVCLGLEGNSKFYKNRLDFELRCTRWWFWCSSSGYGLPGWNRMEKKISTLDCFCNRCSFPYRWKRKSKYLNIISLTMICTNSFEICEGFALIFFYFYFIFIVRWHCQAKWWPMPPRCNR